MNVLYKDVFAGVSFYENNPTKHDIAELEALINRFGFLDSMVMSDSGAVVVAGNGRVKALRSLYSKDCNVVPANIMVYLLVSTFRDTSNKLVSIPAELTVIDAPDDWDKKGARVGVINKKTSITGYEIKGHWFAPFTEASFTSKAEMAAFVIEHNMSNSGGAGYTQEQRLALYDPVPMRAVMSIITDADSALTTIPDTDFVNSIFDASAMMPVTEPDDTDESGVTSSKPQEVLTYDNLYGSGGSSSKPSRSSSSRSSSSTSRPSRSDRPETPVEDFDPVHDAPYTAMTYQLDNEQRVKVLDTIALAKEFYSLSSSNEALVKIMDYFYKNADQIRAEIQI